MGSSSTFNEIEALLECAVRFRISSLRAKGDNVLIATVLDLIMIGESVHRLN